MLTMDVGRHAAIRDLDATLFRLRDVPIPEWERQTPCKGWTVAHLAAHLAESAFSFSLMAARPVEARTGTSLQLEEAGEPDPHVPPVRIVERLTYARNQLYHVTEQLLPEDAEAELAPGNGNGPAFTVERLLTVAAAEFGIHRFDIEYAMGEHEAGLSQETILAASQIYGTRLAHLAQTHGQTPEYPLTLHLQGELIDATLSWDGESWQNREVPGAPVTRVRGADSAITLFLFGRIPADDHRLDVEGDREIAAQFKSWVPGP